MTVDLYAVREMASGVISALRKSGEDVASWHIRSLPASAPGTDCGERVFTVVDDMNRMESAHPDYDTAEARMRERDSDARARGERPSGRRVTSHLLIRRLPNLAQAARREQQLHRAG